jgi:hypothetical protein
MPQVCQNHIMKSMSLSLVTTAVVASRVMSFVLFSWQLPNCLTERAMRVPRIRTRWEGCRSVQFGIIVRKLTAVSDNGFEIAIAKSVSTRPAS